MRKLYLIILFATIFAILIIDSAASEEFTIHSDTTFGMTKKEVKHCEDTAHYSYEDVTDNSNYTHCLYGHDVWSIRGTLAGEDEAIISYHFMNESLVSCVYQFWGKQFATNVIAKLEQKYGNKDYLITDASLNSFIPDSLATHIAIKNGVFSSKLYDVGAWRIPTDNGCSVIITYANFTLEDKGNELERITHVSYELHSDEEIEAAIELTKTQRLNEWDDL